MRLTPIFYALIALLVASCGHLDHVWSSKDAALPVVEEYFAGERTVTVAPGFTMDMESESFLYGGTMFVGTDDTMVQLKCRQEVDPATGKKTAPKCDPLTLWIRDVLDAAKGND